MPKVNEIEIRVKEILEYYPETRENDNLLYVIYLEQYHYIEFNRENYINAEELQLPSFKTIERNRRYIQNNLGLFKPSEKTENKRKDAEKSYIEDYVR